MLNWTDRQGAGGLLLAEPVAFRHLGDSRVGGSLEGCT